MKISKALITLADPNQRSLPLQTLIDQKGIKRSALEIVLEETFSTGIEEVCLIVCPDSQASYQNAAGVYSNRIHFIEQPKPTGYAQAIQLGKEFTGDHPFLHIVGDHLCVSDESMSCAKQVVAIAEKNNASVSGVQATRENQISDFGAVGGKLVDRLQGLYEIQNVVEKPTPTQAELELLVPGLRAGYYLCFFGIHVLKPSIFGILNTTTAIDGPDGRSLSYALNELAKREKLLALEVSGRRYDIGSDYGLLFAQLALSFSGKDRDRVVTSILELLANRPSS
ncbi:sugar phosphate nucleotidyltransferase [Pelagicoccus albus]|uniref:UTP--glucose-1-phosphate uridylyltransferase n=1 Tax=Pelagicoccus albus TaxID=415222 RepID=A0A7X1BBZ7_9BACT|nr:sugar phosphate nucleotidyltransferase [Pelagicoccus albus]MBC2608233.1 UTP--glucose-1-phosphate uridylyltransferase [Pelagicoccus albus]